MSANQSQLLTSWADGEVVRLRNDLVKVERKRKFERGRLHPATRPIWVNGLLIRYFFDPKRRAKSGLVRTLLALHSFAKDGQCFPKVSSIAKRAGIDKSNAKRHLRTLRRIGVIADVEARFKPGRKPGTKVPTSNVYTLWGGENECEALWCGEDDDEIAGHLIDLVFAAATGEGAIYALALRELRINDSGVGAARLDRAKIRRALGEGVRDADNSLVLDRTLSDETIVTHLDALRAAGLLLKVGPSRVTIKPALGTQAIVDGRLWARADKGKRKPRRSAKGELSQSSAPAATKGSSAPTPREVSRNRAPIPGGFLEVPHPELLISELPDTGVDDSLRTTPNYLPPSGSGLQPSPRAGDLSSPPFLASRTTTIVIFRRRRTWQRFQQDVRLRAASGFENFADRNVVEQKARNTVPTAPIAPTIKREYRDDDVPPFDLQ